MENNLNNLPPFYIGQKVIYITGISMPKNSTHVVSDVWKNPCGCWAIYINNQKTEFMSKEYTHGRCTQCGNVHSNSPLLKDNCWNVQSFRPLIEQTFPLIKYSKILEEVPVSAN